MTRGAFFAALALAAIGCQTPCDRLFSRAELEALAGRPLGEPHRHDSKYTCSIDYWGEGARTQVAIQVDKQSPYDEYHDAKRRLESSYRRIARIDAGDEALLAIGSSVDDAKEQAARREGVLGILRNDADPVDDLPPGPPPRKHKILVAVGKKVVTLDFDPALFPEQKLRARVIPGLNDRLRAAGLR